MQGHIYLLHFSAPVGNPANPRAMARHYTGWAIDPEQRNAEHKAGRGAALTRAAVAAGVTWQLFVLCEGSRDTERAIKNLKNARRLCPICGRAHQGGRLYLPVNSHQLTLFDADPFDLPAPAYRPDGLEWAYRKAAERARPAPVVTFDGQSDGYIEF